MKDRGKLGKKHQNESHEDHNSRFPQLERCDDHRRPTLREQAHSPRLHVPSSLTTTLPTLIPRAHITNSQTSTVTQGALLRARNGVSHTKLNAAFVPQAPKMEVSGGGLRCSTVAGSGIMLGRTGKVCPGPSARDLVHLKPLPPVDKRPLESSALNMELSRPTRPKTGKNRPEKSFPINSTKPQKVVRAQQLSTQAQNVPQAPASSKLRGQLGKDQRRDQAKNRFTGFSDVSANTSECVCLSEDSLARVGSVYQARSRPQQLPQPPPKPPQSSSSSSPSSSSPHQVHYTSQPRLLTKRAQMEQRVLKTAVETSKQLPVISLNGSMVCNMGAEEYSRELRQAANKPRAKVPDHEPPLVILSVLRESQHQQVPITCHGRRRNTAVSFRTRRFPMDTQDIHATILEHRVGLETLRRKIKDSRRTREPVHRRRRRITLSLTMPCTFRLRTRKPIFAHRVVLND